MINVGIIGCGFVGGALKDFLDLDASGGESRPKRLFLSLNVKIDSLLPF